MDYQSCHFVDDPLDITEDLVIILPVCLSMTLTICNTLLCVFGRTGLSKQCSPDETPQNMTFHQGLHCLQLVQLFLDTILGSKLYLLKFKIKYGKELRCLNTKSIYVKITDTEIK